MAAHICYVTVHICISITILTHYFGAFIGCLPLYFIYIGLPIVIKYQNDQAKNHRTNLVGESWKQSKSELVPKTRFFVPYKGSV